MSKYQHLKVEKADGVARITFDRPKHNVLDIQMMNELNTELKALVTDDQLKCVVLNGEGASFCAGVEVADHTPEMAPKMIETFNRIFELIDQLEVIRDPGLIDVALGRSVEAEHQEEALAGNGRYPVRFLARWRLRPEIDIHGSVSIDHRVVQAAHGLVAVSADIQQAAGQRVIS